MKKILLVLSILFLTGCEETSILDCKSNENVAGVCIDETEPVIFGANDFEIELNEDFDLTEGVTAIDDLEGDITDQMIITENVDNTKPGTYLVKYEVEDSFLNKTTVLRYITVNRGATPVGVNMVENGDFSNALLGYDIFTIGGVGEGSFDVINEELVVDVTMFTEGIWYAPRLNSDGMYFEKGAFYQVSFDVRSDDDRSILFQVGELLSASPWYNDFTYGYKKHFESTTSWTTHTFVFEMTKASNENGSLLFEFGDISGTMITTVYIDNVSIVKLDDDYVQPSTNLTAPGMIEAEDFDSSDGIQVEVTGDSTGDFNVGYFDYGDYIAYEVHVIDSGYYTVDFRVATDLSDRNMSFLKDDVVLFELDVPYTGGWQEYTNIESDSIYLESGVYTFKIISNSGAVNFNYFQFKKVN